MKLLNTFLTLTLTLCYAKSEVYFIKASGEFGKNLSELAKKYADENGNKVEIFIDEDPRVHKDTRKFKIGVDKKANYSHSLGKELYQAKCQSCHGENFDKRPGGTEPLSKLSAKDIEDTIIIYRTDSSYGKSTRTVMQNIAKNINNSDLGAIIAYIKGKDAFSATNEEENKPVSTQKKRGSYLR